MSSGRHWWSRLWGRHPLASDEQGEAQRQLRRVKAQREEVTELTQRIQRRGDDFTEAFSRALRAKRED